jgi:hypothetical protein
VTRCSLHHNPAFFLAPWTVAARLSRAILTFLIFCAGTAIVSEIGSVEFCSELSALENAAKRSEPVPGTLGMVIAKYLSSPDWEALRPKTWLSYDRAFTVLKQVAPIPGPRQRPRPAVLSGSHP